MSSYKIIQGLIISILALAGGNVWAAQLDGLQVQSGVNKLQVVLDIDKNQDYKIEHSEKSGTTISLPNAKLPEAFQGTGLPPVKNQKTSIKAEVNETSEGLTIRLQGPNAERMPVEVRFKSDLEDMPSAITMPDKDKIQSNQKIQPQAKAFKAPVRRKSYFYKQAKQTSTHQAKSYKPIIKPYTQPVPPERVVLQHPTVSPDAIKETLPKPQHGAIILSGPDSDLEKIAKSVDEETTEDGFNFLNQSAANEEHLVETEPEEPALSKKYTSPFFGETDKVEQAPATPKKEKKSLLGVALKWLGLSMVLLGVLLLAGIFLAIRLKKIMKQSPQVKADLFESTDNIEQETSLEQQQQPFRQYIEQHPNLATSTEYFEKESKTPDHPAQIEEIAEYFEPSSKSKVKNDFPTPEYYEPEKTEPFVTQINVSIPSEDLLFVSPASFSEAVRQNVGGKKLNPYLTSTLKMEHRHPYTSGGPKPLKSPRRAPNIF